VVVGSIDKMQMGEQEESQVPQNNLIQTMSKNEVKRELALL